MQIQNLKCFNCSGFVKINQLVLITYITINNFNVCNQIIVNTYRVFSRKTSLYTCLKYWNLDLFLTTVLRLKHDTNLYNRLGGQHSLFHQKPKS